MPYTLSKRSTDALIGVEPRLVRVVKRAITHTTQDFVVIQGVRTKEQMWENYGKGRTVAQCAAKGVPAIYAKPALRKVTFLNNPLASNHRVHADGFGHAVDIVPFPVDWDTEKKFADIAAAMKRAAHLEGVKIAWGGDWTGGIRDLPHFELI
ncbi:M15 family metallopeptidase [Brevundimonas sp. KM4]|uniref:M15 family metallopeptidase n=1 Tax=Brevundimonas sp. KM4 TaxID=1628191 RepID=UPI0005F892E6|nr:M15 family metallopeptidase [Brevundimonas sp. KM4]KJV42338.1 endolysin [Brevundimonas sp. KM4]